METKILAIFTRTPLHVGAGNSVGAVDSPIMRERHTKIPIIPGSSLKGVLADLWNDDVNTELIETKNGKQRKRRKDSDAALLFGQEKDEKRDTSDSSGNLLIGEARVIAFPVRSAKNAFAWVTCPLALARYKRDMGAGANFELNQIPSENDCYASDELILKDSKIILEEYCFSIKGKPTVPDCLKNAIDDDVWKDVEKRFVIIPDEIFSYFCEHACEVVTRIKVDDETGTVASGALFNQEQMPSETMLYAVISAQDKKDLKASDALKKLDEKIKGTVLQIGGDATIGLGYCSVNLK